MIFLNPLKGKHKELGKIAYSEASLFPVLSADELLVNSNRARIIKKIKKLADVHPDDFQILYNDLIRHFVEYVQVIPAFPFHKLGELMDDALLRGLMAMESCHHYHHAENNPRLTYAVFSAALLFDVAKVATQQRIMISDEEGKFIREWSPYEHSLVGQAEYYKIRFLGPGRAHLSEWITTMIARQIMSQQAFLFIAEDNAILQMWLALFNDDQASARVLGEILSLIKEKFDHFKEMHQLPMIDVELEEPEAVKDGEDFMAWVKENIKKGKLKVNHRDGGVFVVDEGAFLDASLFQQFCEAYRDNVGWIVVAKQFNHLGVGKKSGEDYKFDQFYSEKGESYANQGFMSKHEAKKTAYATKKRGVLVTKTDLIFAKEGQHTVYAHLKPATLAQAKSANAAKARIVKTLPKAKNVLLRNRPP